MRFLYQIDGKIITEKGSDLPSQCPQCKIVFYPVEKKPKTDKIRCPNCQHHEKRENFKANLHEIADAVIYILL